MCMRSRMPPMWGSASDHHRTGDGDAGEACPPSIQGTVRIRLADLDAAFPGVAAGDARKVPPCGTGSELSARPFDSPTTVRPSRVSAVSIADVFDVTVNKAYRDQGMWERDSALDRICGFLVNDEPLHRSPGSEERTRTTAEEDAFFDELAQKPDYLRSARYERWSMVKQVGRSGTSLARRLPLGTGDALLNLGRRRWHALLKWVESSQS